jgi:hypothetical protein
MADRITARGVFARIGAAIVLVLATHNPTGHSYLGWALDDVTDFTPLQAIFGLVMVGAWILYVRAALHSIGLVGAGLMGAAIACLAWLAVDVGWLDPSKTSSFAWIAEIGLGVILGVGLSWSHFRRRLTGQVDVEGGASS